MSSKNARRPSRDSVTTINDDGSRLFLHPADARGKWVIARRLAAILLIAIYVLLPWIPINGQPAVFLDFINRRFHLFGLTFGAGDIWLTFFLITGLAFFLFFTTALFGRLWCGWACPQTVFLEHVFRRVERWIEGDAPQRKQLDAAPWSPEKAVKRVLKHGLFVILAALIAHVFLAYFVSLPQLYEWMRASPMDQARAFGFIVIATGILYFNFVWFREQLCIVICPYGRLQSALIDEHTVNVAYDEKRGEPRGKVGTEGAGDCIDCHRCVQVCPTGIDIRQGLQLECVACTACIDACDEIMDKVKRPHGLIRYASEETLAGRKTRYVRARTVIYTVFMLFGLGAMTLAFSALQSFETNISRMPGRPSYVTDEHVRNQFMLRIGNKTGESARFRVEAPDLPAGMVLVGWEAAVELGPYAEESRPLIFQQERLHYTGPVPVTVEIRREDGRGARERTLEFLGPDPRVFAP